MFESLKPASRAGFEDWTSNFQTLKLLTGQAKIARSPKAARRIY
jgi:hypothetical protein